MRHRRRAREPLGTHDELVEALRGCVGRGSWLFAVLSVDGLGRYQRLHGGAAADELEAELRGRLAEATGGCGRAFALGCSCYAIVAVCSQDCGRSTLSAAIGALTADRGGVHVTPRVGGALLPREADTPDAALALAVGRLEARVSVLNALAS